MSPTPAGSGKSARPVPAGRGTLTHRQRSCRAASAGAVKRGARRHSLSEKKKRTQQRPLTEFSSYSSSGNKFLMLFLVSRRF
ncbi:hypothetical protein [Shigella flexneri]|uniref:hypothetical protein n=1 Tax=Shigella flexneri TaxID=623 RepID=UPI0027DA831F|nr:hypothetical protein [Shigella flexneri]